MYNALNELLNTRIYKTSSASIQISDGSSVAFNVSYGVPYIYFNTHVFNTEVCVIAVYSSSVHVKRIYSTNPSDVSTFTFNSSTNLTIKGASNCRGTLWRLGNTRAV